MKTLNFEEMEDLLGGKEGNWKDFVDGACLAVQFLYPYGTGACLVWSAGRLFEFF